MEIKKINLLLKESFQTEKGHFIYKGQSDGIFIDVISKNTLIDQVEDIKAKNTDKTYKVLKLENVLLVCRSRDVDGKTYYNQLIFVGFSTDKKDVVLNY